MLGKDERRSSLGVEPAEEVVHRARLTRVGRDRVTAQSECGPRRVPPSSAMAHPQLVHTGVLGDGEEPGTGGRVAPEAGEPAQGADEALLGEVVGALAVDERRAELPHLVVDGPHQGVPGCIVTAGGIEGQLRQRVHAGDDKARADDVPNPRGGRLAGTVRFGRATIQM